MAFLLLSCIMSTFRNMLEERNTDKLQKKANYSGPFDPACFLFHSISVHIFFSIISLILLLFPVFGSPFRHLVPHPCLSSVFKIRVTVDLSIDFIRTSGRILKRYLQIWFHPILPGSLRVSNLYFLLIFLQMHPFVRWAVCFESFSACYRFFSPSVFLFYSHFSSASSIDLIFPHFLSFSVSSTVHQGFIANLYTFLFYSFFSPSSIIPNFLFLFVPLGYK